MCAIFAFSANIEFPRKRPDESRNLPKPTNRLSSVYPGTAAAGPADSHGRRASNAAVSGGSRLGPVGWFDSDVASFRSVCADVRSERGGAVQSNRGNPELIQRPAPSRGQNLRSGPAGGRP